MVKLLHAADLHLDSAFAALGEEQARQRRQESRLLLGRMVDYANDHGAQLMLLSGDLFDGERIYAETLEEAASALGRFRGHVVIAPGNHDPYAYRSPYAKALWPENVHIFTKGHLEKLELPQYGCTVYGAAFTAPEMGEPTAFTASDDGGKVKLLVIHGDVGAAGSRYRPISVSWLAQSGVDYAALGHVHEYRGVQYAGKTAYAYPGCPEGRGFDELGDKGFLFGEVGEGSVNLRFVPFARRRYRIVQVDVTDRDAAAVGEALQGAREDICRVILTGERDEPLDREMLEQELAGCAWQLELRDETRRKEDLWQHCGEDSLRGLFLAELRKEYDTADAARRTVIEQAVRYGLAAMENRDL